MSRIVVMEDDNGTRMLIAAILKKDGHEVLEADNGEAGLRLVLAHMPDLVMSDVEMPRMSGLEALAQIRAAESVANTPVILLTSLAQRDQMRAGMLGGADDYITKPFKPAELREAVAAQLGRVAVRSALSHIATERALHEQRIELDKLYTDQFASQYSTRFTDDDLVTDEKHSNATLLSVHVNSYGALAQRLSSNELGEVVRRFYGYCSDTINLFGAHHVEFDGSGMLAMFVEGNDTNSVTHGLRAVKAAFGLQEASNRADVFMQSAHAGRTLPRFTICAVLDTGPVTLARMKDTLGTGRAHTVLVGDTMATARAMQPLVEAKGWAIGATVNTMRTVSGAVRVGARALLPVVGRQQPVDAGELTAVTA